MSTSQKIARAYAAQCEATKALLEAHKGADDGALEMLLYESIEAATRQTQRLERIAACARADESRKIAGA